jgi:hypothetical protein
MEAQPRGQKRVLVNRLGKAQPIVPRRRVPDTPFFLTKVESSRLVNGLAKTGRNANDAYLRATPLRRSRPFPGDGHRTPPAFSPNATDRQSTFFVDSGGVLI